MDDTGPAATKQVTCGICRQREDRRRCETLPTLYVCPDCWVTVPVTARIGIWLAAGALAELEGIGETLTEIADAIAERAEAQR